VEPPFEVVGSAGLSKKDAIAASQTLLEIEREQGRLSTEEQLDALISKSRPKDSPTHHLFGDLWDPSKAQIYALRQRARHIVMAIRVVFEDRPEIPVRAFPTVVVKGKKGPYPMQKVFGNKELTAAVVEQALLDLQNWSRRYDRLREVLALAPIFSSVDRATKKRGKP
jgi:hypothetical protein